MNVLSIFQFQQAHDVRVQLINNEPLFCLTDVTSILKIKNAHASRFNLNLSGVHKMYTPTYNQHGAEVNQEITFINEPNLYRVIFRSNKKEAIDFQNWVFEEVLPTIRKTGSYSLTINLEQQQLIQQAVNERAYRTGEKHKAIYILLHQEFKIPRYAELPAYKFDDAIKFLGGINTNKDYRKVNVNELKVIYNHIATIQEYYYRVFDLYNENLADFLTKNSPHLNYNISIALEKIRMNIRLSANKIYSEIYTKHEKNCGFLLK